MIEEITKMNPPDWLLEITPESIDKISFPLCDVLQDSLYYPGSGTDGKPVRWLAGNAYSFIYVDYMVSRERLLSEIQSETDGFNGYRVLVTRDVTQKELTPNGWRPFQPTRHHGNPMAWSEHFAKPFCVWIIFERLPCFSPEHGPERFSLLYLCGEGVASYQALYNSNKLKPKILFLIQHGFGCNWTNFEDQDEALAESILANEAGMPDWLIGRYQSNESNESYWPRYYSGQFLRYLGGGHDFAVWPLRG